MLARLREAVTAQLVRVEVMTAPPEPEPLPVMEAHHIDASTGADEFGFASAVDFGEPTLVPSGGEPAAAAVRDPNNPATWGRVGRNEACPCGSGKKFKHCHGRFA